MKQPLAVPADDSKRRCPLEPSADVLLAPADDDDAVTSHDPVGGRVCALGQDLLDAASHVVLGGALDEKRAHAAIHGQDVAEAERVVRRLREVFVALDLVSSDAALPAVLERERGGRRLALLLRWSLLRALWHEGQLFERLHWSLPRSRAHDGQLFQRKSQRWPQRAHCQRLRSTSHSRPPPTRTATTNHPSLMRCRPGGGACGAARRSPRTWRRSWASRRSRRHRAARAPDRAR